MVSEAGVEANRKNARNSTGPTSPEGKAISAGNARVHGLAAASVHSETTHPMYPKRLKEWASRYLVTSPEARFALETAVAMTFRLDECRARYREAMDEDRERAEHAWDSDRRAEAAALMGRIACGIP